MSGAALAFLASANASRSNSWVIAMFIVVINVYGFLMSLKHYERSRQHVAVGARYRTAVSDVSPLGNLRINGVRAEAKREHEKQFPLSRRVRAYTLWAGLHLILAALGTWFLVRS